MGKCTKCSSGCLSGDYLLCGVCNCKIHLICSNISDNAIKLLKNNKNIVYKCDKCIAMFSRSKINNAIKSVGALQNFFNMLNCNEYQIDEADTNNAVRTSSKSQFITYKDGKFGVNFGGYHAEAGLGGLLTGDAAHGGLSASAGTPYGQRAGAGLGGSVDGNAGGLLYAGAEANPQVGAGAVIAGDTSNGGFMGAQAFSNGKTVASTKSHTFTSAQNGQLETMLDDGPVRGDIKPDQEPVYNVEKVKPPKKYHVNKHRITVHNRADDISTIKLTTKTPNRNDDNHDVDNAAAAAAAITKKTKSPNVVDVQHPEHSATVPVAAAGYDTTKSVKRINNQQNDSNTTQSSYVDISNKAITQLSPPPSPSAPATVTTHVVSKQRLRQKSRLRPQLQRKLQRQRERLAQAQRAESQAGVGSGSKQQQTDVLVQQYAQYYTPNTEVNIPQTRYLTKNVEKTQYDYPAASAETNVNIRPGVVTNALQIPIGILRSLQESLGGLSVAKQTSVHIN